MKGIAERYFSIDPVVTHICMAGCFTSFTLKNFMFQKWPLVAVNLTIVKRHARQILREVRYQFVEILMSRNVHIVIEFEI
jgi:hypothetical protein